jgi:hypothetical protein
MQGQFLLQSSDSLFVTSHDVSAGPVNAFLSWRLFVPLSRLTYSTYLCHYVILLYHAGSSRAPGYLSDYTVVSIRGKHKHHLVNIIVQIGS